MDLLVIALLVLLVLALVGGFTVSHLLYIVVLVLLFLLLVRLAMGGSRRL